MSLDEEARALIALSRRDERRNRLAGEAFRAERALAQSDTPAHRLAFARAAALWLIVEAEWAMPDRRAALFAKLTALCARLSFEPEDRPVAHLFAQLVHAELARPLPPAGQAAPREAAAELLAALRDRFPFDVALGKSLKGASAAPPPATGEDVQRLERRVAALEKDMIAEVWAASRAHRALELGERIMTVELSGALRRAATDAAGEAARVAGNDAFTARALDALARAAPVLGWMGDSGRAEAEQALLAIVRRRPLTFAEARACERALVALAGAVARPEHRSARTPGRLFEYFVTTPLELDLLASLPQVVRLAARLADKDQLELDGADVRTALHAVFHLGGAACWDAVPGVLEAARVPRATRSPRVARAACACVEAWVAFARWHRERVQEHRALFDWGRQVEIAPPALAADTPASSAARRVRLAWEHAHEDGDLVAAEVLMAPLLGLVDEEMRAELARQLAADASGFWAERSELYAAALAGRLR